MRVLLLGPSGSPLAPFLQIRDEVVVTDRPVLKPQLLSIRPDWIVSYGYRHILPREVLDWVEGRAVNLHISFLPWNRGADPNLWSFVEGTPKGVSIHYIDEGVDTGDLIARQSIRMHEGDTLASTYERLHETVQALFVKMWPAVRIGTAPRVPQPRRGTYHCASDRQRLEHLLVDGWKTPVRKLREEAA